MVDDIAQKRLAVTGAYGSKAWADKVKKMSDEQVIAIYLRFKNQKKI